MGGPLDHLEPVFGTGAEFEQFVWLWVEATGEHALYDGPHLYPRETVQVLIEEGFINADGVSLPCGWIPTRTFPSKDLELAWKELESCGGGKLMILSTIGLWTIQTRTKWFARRTDCEDDMPGPVTVKTFREDGTVMMCPTELQDNRTMLPFSLLCLFDEQRRMHKARQLVARVPRIIPHGCVVDGLFFSGPPDAEIELKRLADEYRYAHNDGTVYQFKDECLWKQVPKCKAIEWTRTRL